MGNTASTQGLETNAILPLVRKMEPTKGTTTGRVQVGIFGEPLLAKPPKEKAFPAAQVPAASETGTEGQENKLCQEPTNQGPPLALPDVATETKNALPSVKPKTYADATNLAAQFPELTPNILSSPFAGDILDHLPSPARSCSAAVPAVPVNDTRLHRQPLQHTYEQPNWALAASDDVSGPPGRPQPPKTSKASNKPKQVFCRSLPGGQVGRDRQRLRLGHAQETGSRHLSDAENRPSPRNSVQPHIRNRRGRNHLPTPLYPLENITRVSRDPTAQLRQSETISSKNLKLRLPHRPLHDSGSPQTVHKELEVEMLPSSSGIEALVLASDVSQCLPPHTKTGVLPDTTDVLSTVGLDVNVTVISRGRLETAPTDIDMAYDDPEGPPMADQDRPVISVSMKSVHRTNVSGNVNTIEETARRSLAKTKVDGQAHNVGDEADVEPVSNSTNVTTGGRLPLQAEVSISSLAALLPEDTLQVPVTPQNSVDLFGEDVSSSTLDSGSSAGSFSLPFPGECATPTPDPSGKARFAGSLVDLFPISKPAAGSHPRPISIHATSQGKDARELAASYAREKAMRCSLNPQGRTEELVPDIEGSGGPGGLSGGVALGLRPGSYSGREGYRLGRIAAYSRPSAHVVYAPEGEEERIRRRRQRPQWLGGRRLNVGRCGGDGGITAGTDYDGGSGWSQGLGGVVVVQLPTELGLGMVFYECSGMD